MSYHNNNNDRADGWRRLFPAAVLGLLLALAVIGFFFFVARQAGLWK
jgi:hypothetical protein